MFFVSSATRRTKRVSCFMYAFGVVWVNQVCVCVCRFHPAGLKSKASACDGRCEDPNKAREKKSSCFWDKAICYHSHPHRLDNGKVPRRRRYKHKMGVGVVVCRPVEEKRKPRPDAPSANRKLTSNMAAKRTP